MAELTEQQLRLAAEAWGKSAHAQNDPIGANLHCFMRALEAAAPYLQLPWDEPSEEEVEEAMDAVIRAHSLMGRERNWKVREVIREFVNRRNPPPYKPIDPRRGKIVDTLRLWGFSEDYSLIRADELLAVLGEGK